MKKRVSIIGVGLIVIFVSGCIALNWAEKCDKINFLPEIAKKLELSTCPISLMEPEKNALLSSLHGSVKEVFTNSQLSEDIKVYWYETTKGIQKDSFTFVRISKDKSWYEKISYSADGQIFSEGGGQVDNDWIRKWLIDCTKH